MSDERPDVRFAVVPLPNDDARSNEFARTMVPHPLVHQELPYDPQYTSTFVFGTELGARDAQLLCGFAVTSTAGASKLAVP